MQILLVSGDDLFSARAQQRLDRPGLYVHRTRDLTEVGLLLAGGLAYDFALVDGDQEKASVLSILATVRTGVFTENLPVIIFVSSADDDFILEAYHAGADMVLDKSDLSSLSQMG
jgi:DNA-binding response OmpR family regulator